MLFPGQAYKIKSDKVIPRESGPTYIDSIVVLIDMDGVGNDVKARIRDVFTGKDYLVSDFTLLQPADAIEKIYTIESQLSLLYSKDFGKTIKRFTCDSQDKMDNALIQLKENGYVNGKYLNINSLFDFKNTADMSV